MGFGVEARQNIPHISTDIIEQESDVLLDGGEEGGDMETGPMLHVGCGACLDEEKRRTSA